MDEQKPFRPETAIKILPPQPSATKFRIIIALIVYSAVLGPIFAILPEQETPLDTIVIVPLLVLAVAWCLFDARERGHRVGCLMKLLLIFVFIVGFPIYLISTRGLASFKTLGLTMGLIVLMLSCMVATGLTTLFICDKFFPDFLVG